MSEIIDWDNWLPVEPPELAEIGRLAEAEMKHNHEIQIQLADSSLTDESWLNNLNRRLDLEGPFYTALETSGWAYAKPGRLAHIGRLIGGPVMIKGEVKAIGQAEATGDNGNVNLPGLFLREAYIAYKNRTLKAASDITVFVPFLPEELGYLVTLTPFEEEAY